MIMHLRSDVFERYRGVGLDGVVRTSTGYSECPFHPLPAPALRVALWLSHPQSFPEHHPLGLNFGTMVRTASVLAASAALYGASCFVAPSAPRSAPQVQGGFEAFAASAESAAEIPFSEANSSWSFSPLALGAALGLAAAVLTSSPALAADLENGESIFLGNCAACHAGGNNSVRAEKKIKKEELITYGKYDIGAITTQVTNGYGAMPAFGEKLGPDDIDDVANYVYNKADKW
ncbi:unnamed protein product [Polarella glacialis]|uniref:Cytochrome c-553 n=2 Tax=Polarella glacialis TaxID=89957 RepID=A0A813J1B3_POLGL|nr:unnamed protein product [Polarella glacialis]